MGHCSVCNRKKFMTVSDNTNLLEGLSDFFNSLCKSSVKVKKKTVKKILKSSERALEIGTSVGTAFVSRSPKRLCHHYLK